MPRIDIPENVLNSMLQGRASGLSYTKLAEKHGYKVNATMRAVKECGLTPDALRRTGQASLKLPAYWRASSRAVNAKVLILQGPCSGLSVRKKQLVVFDADREISYMPGLPPFESIIAEAPGFHVTGEALKWLARHEVGLFVATGHNTASVMLTTPPAKQAKLRLAQYAAFSNPLPVASAIVTQKILASCECGFLSRRETHAHLSRVKMATDLPNLLLAEGVAAQAHFIGLRRKLVFRGLGKDWPEAWDSWDSRNASLCNPSPRHALHPFNAILNYAYMVAAAQIERALTAWGFDTAIGFLHLLKEYRASLVYDALELQRGPIDARILSFTANRTFRRKEFTLSNNGVVRLAPEIARIVAGRALATQRDLSELCEWLESAVRRGDGRTTSRR